MNDLPSKDVRIPILVKRTDFLNEFDLVPMVNVVKNVDESAGTREWELNEGEIKLVPLLASDRLEIRNRRNESGKWWTSV